MSTVEVSLTVGKLDASLALLTTQDHHVIEFPTVLLPDNVKAGSIITMNVRENVPEEQRQRKTFEEIQQIILEKYGSKKPSPPVLKVVNTTQTSCVLSWEQLSLGSAKLKQLILYRQGIRSAVIPNPFKVTSTKISGLSVDTPYEFQLKLITTSGQYWSEKIKVRTHKMTDMSGITVCLGPLDPLLNINETQIKDCLKIVGARDLQKHVAIDTTHFICNDVDNEDDEELIKAKNNNIPIVRPEWIRACAVEKRIVGVRGFYLDADKGILKNYPFPPPSTRSPTPSSNVEKQLVPEVMSTQIPEEPKEANFENPLTDENVNEEPTSKNISTEESRDEDAIGEEESNDRTEQAENDAVNSEARDKEAIAEEESEDRTEQAENDTVNSEARDEEAIAEEESEDRTEQAENDAVNSEARDEEAIAEEESNDKTEQAANDTVNSESRDENAIAEEESKDKTEQAESDNKPEREEEVITKEPTFEETKIKGNEKDGNVSENSDNQNNIGDKKVVEEEPLNVNRTTDESIQQEESISDMDSEESVIKETSDNQLADEKTEVDNVVTSEAQQLEEGEEASADEPKSNDTVNTDVDVDIKDDATSNNSKSKNNKKKNKKKKNKRR